MRVVGFVVAWLLCSGLVQAREPQGYKLVTDTAAPHQRIALIIPGMGQVSRDTAYQAIGAYYQACGITPVYVDVAWNQVGLNHLANTADQVADEIAQAYPAARIRLCGFSFGAVLAYKLSQTIASEQVLLCSLSPVFAEDLQHQLFLFHWLALLYTDYATNRLSFAQPPRTPCMFFYGEHDSFLINAAIKAGRKQRFPESPVMIVKSAGHQLTPEYLQAIQNAVAGGLPR